MLGLDLKSMWRFDQSFDDASWFDMQWLTGSASKQSQQSVNIDQCGNYAYQSQAQPERGSTSATNHTEESLASNDMSGTSTLKDAPHDSSNPHSRPCLNTAPPRHCRSSSEPQVITADMAARLIDPAAELVEQRPRSEGCAEDEARPTPGVAITILLVNHRTGTDGKGPGLARVVSHRTYQKYSLATAQKQELIMQLSSTSSTSLRSTGKRSRMRRTRGGAPTKTKCARRQWPMKT